MLLGFSNFEGKSEKKRDVMKFLKGFGRRKRRVELWTLLINVFCSSRTVLFFTSFFVHEQLLSFFGISTSKIVLVHFSLTSNTWIKCQAGSFQEIYFIPHPSKMVICKLPPWFRSCPTMENYSGYSRGYFCL